MNFPVQFWENHNRKEVFLHELRDKKGSIGGYTQGQSKVNAVAED